MTTQNVKQKLGYKQTELGVIPEDWEVKRLGEIANISSGGTPERSNPTYWGGDVPWVTTTQIDFNVIDKVNELITRKGLENSAARIYDPGTLLMAMYGQGKTRGKIAVLAMNAAINQACAAIKLNKGILSKYVFFNLSARYDEIRSLSNTGSQENLNGTIIKNILIPIPKEEKEQHAIAAALSDVDALITSFDKLITKKRNIKQATMQQLLTGKMRLPGFSGKWEEKELGEIFNVTAGGDFDPHRSSSIQNEVYRYPIYSNALSNNGLYGFCSYNNHYAGSITVTARGTLGAANFRNFDFTAIGRLLVLQPNIIMDGRFFSEFINSQIDFVVESTGVPQLTAPQISKYDLPVPPLHEQIAIVTILTDMDAEIVALEQRRDKTRALKQGMMQELLTGKTRLL